MSLPTAHPSQPDSHNILYRASGPLPMPKSQDALLHSQVDGSCPHMSHKNLFTATIALALATMEDPDSRQQALPWLQ
jgi:hypothetical protein